MRRTASIATVVGVGLAIGSPFLLGSGNVLAGLRDVPLQMMLILAGLAAVSGVAKAGKLQVLLASLGQRPVFLRTLAISLATDFAFLSSPAGAAGYVVNAALLRNSGISWVVATAVVGTEQAIDLVFFALAIPVAAVSGLGPLMQVAPRLSGSVYLVLLPIALSASGTLWCCRKRLAVAIHALACTVPWLKGKQERLNELLAELRTQVDALLHGDARRNLALLLLTTLQWLSRYGILWIALLGLGYRLPFGFVVALQAGVLHLAQWTGIPAGGGSADMALAAALAPWVPSSIMVTALILWRSATLYLPLLAGVLSLAALTGRWRATAKAA